MTSLLAILNLLKGLGGVLMKVLPSFLIYRQGEKNERLKNAEKTLENVKKGNVVEFDDSFDDKLRDKYNRN